MVVVDAGTDRKGGAHCLNLQKAERSPCSVLGDAERIASSGGIAHGCKAMRGKPGIGWESADEIAMMASAAA